jgi:hypothetical protein
LISLAGIASIPDGFVVSFETRNWYIVEVELARHDPRTHVATQINDFTVYIDNKSTRHQLIDAFDKSIKDDKTLEAKVRNWLGETEIHAFLSKVVFGDPKIIIVIDTKTDKLVEATKVFKPLIVDFKVFEREGIGVNVHAVQFESILEQIPASSYKEKEIIAITPSEFISRFSDFQKEALRTIEEMVSKLGSDVKTAYKGNAASFRIIHVFLQVWRTNDKQSLTVNFPYGNKLEDNKKLLKGQGNGRYLHIQALDQISEIEDYIKQAYKNTLKQK